MAVVGAVEACDNGLGAGVGDLIHSASLMPAAGRVQVPVALSWKDEGPWAEWVVVVLASPRRPLGRRTAGSGAQRGVGVLRSLRKAARPDLNRWSRGVSVSYTHLTLPTIYS